MHDIIAHLERKVMDDRFIMQIWMTSEPICAYLTGRCRQCEGRRHRCCGAEVASRVVIAPFSLCTAVLLHLGAIIFSKVYIMNTQFYTMLQPVHSPQKCHEMSHRSKWPLAVCSHWTGRGSWRHTAACSTYSVLRSYFLFISICAVNDTAIDRASTTYFTGDTSADSKGHG